MTPIISSTGQTRSRLPTKWMQSAPSTTTTSTTKLVDAHSSPSDNPMRWSTHTLAADPHDTIRSRADSTTSTFVDTFAHRRKNRISDLTFVDQLEDAVLTHRVPQSESFASSLNDASLTLNNDDDGSDLTHLTPSKAALTRNNEINTRYDHDSIQPLQQSNAVDDNDDDLDDNVMAQRIDRLMAATMEALEASNQLVLDTLSSRAKLAQLNAIEAALDTHLDAREAHLKRQIRAVTDMADFVAKTSAELQKLTGTCSGPSRVPSGVASTSQPSTLADTAELQVREAAATGIVQALDRDATIGKTAAKRLERMLQTPSPTASPTSAAPSQHKKSSSSSSSSSSSGASRRAFSISNFASIQSSIAEEARPETENVSVTPSGSGQTLAVTPSGSRTSTPQKKRAVSYDSRAPGALKLVSKLAPSTAASSVASSTDSSNGPKKHSTMRPSLMATLRQDPTLASSSQSSREDTTTRSQTRSVSGLPSYTGSAHSKASASVSMASASVESTLAALPGMPSTAASESSRTETPSESSYFDSAIEDSTSSASPPTPGSIHAIHGVLATPWKPAASHESEQDSADAATPSSQPRSARRASVYSNLASPRASLSISDRDRAQQLSSQLAGLAAERVTWNPQSVASAESGTAGNSTSGAGAGGGGALRALQKLNEMSAAKIAGHGGAAAEQQGGSKRVSLGLGLPSFSALRPSTSRSTSTTNAASPTASADKSASQFPPSAKVAEDTSAKASTSPTIKRDQASATDSGTVTPAAADVSSSSSSLLGGGWRSWASWNAAPAASGSSDTSTPQKSS